VGEDRLAEDEAATDREVVEVEADIRMASERRTQDLLYRKMRASLDN